MGREVRMVPADWEHPRYTKSDAEYPNWIGKFRPLSYGYAEAETEFMDMATSTGLQSAVEYYGQAPNRDDYMPDWQPEECTHYMMYENTSEGTPISPAFATAEELAHWLADNGASAFADMTATYEQWLATLKRGSAHSATLTSHGMVSGVEDLAERGDKT